MATYAQNLEKLRVAQKGADVRNAMIEMFDEVWGICTNNITVGNNINPGTTSESFNDGQLFINTDTMMLLMYDAAKKSWINKGYIPSITNIAINESTVDSGTTVVTLSLSNNTSKAFNVKNGRGISSIVKTNTSANVDTYTVTYSDNTTSTFTVTNANYITGFTKSSNGLTDTYTFSFNDSSLTYSFDVNNGVGVDSFELLKTEGLIKTYRMSFNDNSSKDIEIENGNGISSITKSSTSGLVDTYAITYTDGTTTTFNVTNGRGITSFAKEASSGQVDTYAFNYNDGTKDTFDIVNGLTVTYGTTDLQDGVSELEDGHLYIVY